MGEKKARLKAFADKAAKTEEYIRNYQYSLRTLMRASPNVDIGSVPKAIAAIGLAEIWPCKDGAVVLIYEDPNREIKVDTKEPLSKTVDEFMKNGNALAFYDVSGNRVPFKSVISIGDAKNSIIHFADNIIKIDNVKYVPRYQRGMIAGWEAELPNADEEALKDFRSVFVTRNIAGENAANVTFQESQSILLASSTKIIEEFTELLDSAELEEELQKYITENPQILYPDYIECYPKFKLGEDLVTDYVFLVQGHEGLEYIFVEIERSNKSIYTNSGQFSSHFTQAKDQILDWEHWVTHNQAYISRKLLNLYKPKYHLVMGRSSNITQQEREKLRTEFSSTNRKFSTFDDVLNHFKQVKERIEKRL
jgi:hypothetical protein